MKVGSGPFKNSLDSQEFLFIYCTDTKLILTGSETTGTTQTEEDKHACQDVKTCFSFSIFSFRHGQRSLSLMEMPACFERQHSL